MHHIRRQTFEISFPSQEKAFDLQTRFTALMHQTLLPVIEEVFSQVSLPNVIIRLEKIEIDLGETDIERLEQDLPDKLRDSLTEALLAAIGEIRYFPTENNQLVARAKADVELLVYFLENGTLPWWASHPGQGDFSLTDLLQQCLAARPGLLLTHLQQTMQAEEVRIRLIRQFADEAILRLLSVLIPARLQFVKSFVTGLFQFQQTRLLIKTSTAAFREMVWSFTIDFVVLQKRTSFEDKIFAETLFIHLTKQLYLPMPPLLLAVSRAAGKTTRLSAEQFTVETITRQIMAEYRIRRPEEFTEGWQSTGTLEYIRKQSQAERFSELILAAEPTQAIRIEELFRLLHQVFRQAASQSSVNSQQVSQVIREAIIHYVYTERRSGFDMPQLLKSTLTTVMQTLNIPVELVIHHLPAAGQVTQAIQLALQKIAEANPQLLISSAYSIIDSKHADTPAAYARLLLETKIKPPARYSDFDILTFYFRYGVVPWTERIRTKPALITELIETMRETQPEQLRSWILTSGLIRQPAAVQRIRTLFSPEMAAWLLGENKDGLPAQTLLLTREDLLAKEDVLIHYLTQYLETGLLPAQLPLSVPQLVQLFISAYPEICQSFISTLPETQQQTLLEISPELVDFLADEFIRDTAGILPEKEDVSLADKMNAGTIPEQQPVNLKKDLSPAGFSANDTGHSADNLSANTEEQFPSAQTSSSDISQKDQFDFTPGLQKSANDQDEFFENLSQKQTVSPPEDSTETAGILPDAIPADPDLPTQENDETGVSSEQIRDLQNSVEDNNTSAIEQSASDPEKKETSHADTKGKEKKSPNAFIEEPLPSDQEIFTPETQDFSTATDYVPDALQAEHDTKSSQAPATHEPRQNKVNPSVEPDPDTKASPAKASTQKPSEYGRYVWRQPEEPLYIRNAGLVLLHPYLGRFFTMLKLTANRKFTDEQAAQRGVHLLHYVSHKSEQAPEYELTLNKILCGLPVSLPLETGVELTDEEKETCESLIQGVIQNWPILKNTSPDNFRVSFLHREGRLLYTPEDWQLKVENRGYDVLLDKLPWAYSMIKLPWMEKVLQVEWR